MLNSTTWRERERSVSLRLLVSWLQYRERTLEYQCGSEGEEAGRNL